MMTISLCMIVKNEEALLARCLDSLKDLMDEIIIVDTGSNDRTKEIAASYTDNVYDYQWTNDFAAARNFSFSKASMEYIYCADADEVLDEENRARFRDLKKVLLPEIDIVQMKYAGQLTYNTAYNYDEEYRPKLYKRLRSFRFEGPVHEAVVTEPVVFDSDIRILHKPHGSHTDRDLRIFRDIYGAPDAPHMPGRLLSMYAKELFISGTDAHFIEAAPIMESILIKEDRSAEDVLTISCVLARAFRIKKDIANFFKYAMKAVVSESCSEICMELGTYYEQAGDLNEAHIWYYNAAFETKPVLNIHYGGDMALSALARVLESAGLTGQAALYRKQAEAWSVPAQ